MKVSAIEQRSFARNYVDGVFKVTEVTFAVSAITRQLVSSRALMMSSDRGTTKRIVNFASSDDNSVINGDVLLKDAKRVVIAYQFIDLPIQPITREYEDIDFENNSLTYIVDNEILNIGDTRLVQHYYIDYGNGVSLDVGAVSATIQTSFIDMEENGLGGLNPAQIKTVESLFDFSIEGE